MEPIIVAKKIQNGRREVAGVVVIRIWVTTIVLQHIQGNNTKLGERVGHEDKEDELLPVGHYQHSVEAGQEKLLHFHLPIYGALVLTLGLKIRFVVAQHIIPDEKEKQQAI